MQHVPPVAQQLVAQMSASGIKFRLVRAAVARAPPIIYTVPLTQSVVPIVTLELHIPLCVPSSDVTDILPYRRKVQWSRRPFYSPFL
jgi:hypothetical protein